jgi:hypothetical protein
MAKKVFEELKFCPVTATSMVTETALLGTVIEYHTSLAVPQVLNGVPTVAWYSEELICVQLVPGGNSVGEEQSSFDG